MQDVSLQQLFPHNESVPQKGLYLQEQLYAAAVSADKPLLYANLLSSLDGRIALANENSVSGMSTPEAIRSRCDWALFCELQAQADVLVTHTGYLRSLANNDLGNVLSLPVGAEADYLHDFRKKAGLTAQPKVLILSNSLEFDPSILPMTATITVLSNRSAPDDRIRSIEASGAEVKILQGETVSASAVLKQLENMNAKSVYLQTGPSLLHELLTEELLDCFYLTTDLSFAGGEHFKTLCEGGPLTPERRMRLKSMYLHCEEQTDVFRQQLFSSYEKPL